jgi:uncharacterized repeat protein (TIGR01451 family)
MRSTRIGFFAAAACVVVASVPAAARAATSADLSVTQSAAPEPGGALTFTDTVTNHGPSRASSVVLRELVAGTGLTSVKVASSSLPTKCKAYNPPAGYQFARHCNINSLAADASWVVTFTVTGPTGTAVKARAAIPTGTTDPDAANNASVVNSWLGPVARLSISVSGPAPLSCQAGTQTCLASWPFVVTNNGPNATVDARARGGAFRTNTGEACDISRGYCDIGVLAAGQSRVGAVVTGTSPMPGRVTVCLSDPGSFNPDATNGEVCGSAVATS